MEKTKVAGSQKAVLGNVLLLSFFLFLFFFLSFSLSFFLPSHVSRIGVCLKYTGYVGFFIPLADKEIWNFTFLVFRSSCDPHSCLPSDLALSLLFKQNKLVKLVVGLVRGLLEIWQDERNTKQKALWMSIGLTKVVQTPKRNLRLARLVCQKHLFM